MTILSEEWRPVVGFEGFYEVSNLGVVRSLDRLVNGRIKGTRVMRRGKTLKSSLDKDGYSLIILCKDGVRKTTLVHRVVLVSFVGPKPKGKEARHFPDRTRSNNRLDNLLWGTAKENAADREIDGNTCSGENHWARKDYKRFKEVVQKAGWSSSAKGERASQAKATEEAVRTIRAEYKKGSREFGLAALGKKYNLDLSTIHDIVSRKTWRHVA